jgi:ATP phosphoribosyltransferase regulatory subunit
MAAAALEQARAVLPNLPAVVEALDELTACWRRQCHGQVSVAVDLSDLRGDGYHNGATFAAYVGGQASAVALGGRYDGAGSVFGRSPAGYRFSARSAPDPRLPAGTRARGGILAPSGDDATCVPHCRIARRRRAGRGRIAGSGAAHVRSKAVIGCNTDGLDRDNRVAGGHLG